MCKRFYANTTFKRLPADLLRIVYNLTALRETLKLRLVVLRQLLLDLVWCRRLFGVDKSKIRL